MILTALSIYFFNIFNFFTFKGQKIYIYAAFLLIIYKFIKCACVDNYCVVFTAFLLFRHCVSQISRYVLDFSEKFYYNVLKCC